MAAPAGLAAMDLVDRTVSQTVFYAVEALGIDIKQVSPITKGLPFVASPTPVVLSVVGYLIVVKLWIEIIRYSGLKPRISDPFYLHALVVAHNLFLCGLSLYMGIGLAYEAWKHKFTFLGNELDLNHVAMGRLIYLFYVSKLYEFVDTVIMLLKRNLRQVSYLHVYHHASISIIWWLMAYRCPGGDAYFSALFNSWVHVFMYLYYLLSALIGKDEKCRRKYLFWGKYLTMLQMLQFMSFIGQAVFGIFSPQYYPRGICRLLLVYSLSLLLFFCDFFFKKYGARRDSNDRNRRKEE